MSVHFPDLPESAPSGGLPLRAARMPGWPRLMGERMAADYLGVGTEMLRAWVKPKKKGGRTLWDIRDLDRAADALDGQPLDPAEAESHSDDVERRWRDKRAREGKGDGSS